MSDSSTHRSPHCDLPMLRVSGLIIQWGGVIKGRFHVIVLYSPEVLLQVAALPPHT